MPVASDLEVNGIEAQGGGGCQTGGPGTRGAAAREAQEVPAVVRQFSTASPEGARPIAQGVSPGDEHPTSPESRQGRQTLSMERRCHAFGDGSSSRDDAMSSWQPVATGGNAEAREVCCRHGDIPSPRTADGAAKRGPPPRKGRRRFARGGLREHL